MDDGVRCGYWDLVNIYQSGENIKFNYREDTSDLMKNFISECLEKNIADRKSAETLLTHPWLDVPNDLFQNWFHSLMESEVS